MPLRFLTDTRRDQLCFHFAVDKDDPYYILQWYTLKLQSCRAFVIFSIKYYLHVHKYYGTYLCTWGISKVQILSTAVLFYFHTKYYR